MSIDLHTLSGAYAVNALSAEEAESFAHHLLLRLSAGEERFGFFVEPPVLPGERPGQS